jgi:hypothetical protein
MRVPARRDGDLAAGTHAGGHDGVGRTPERASPAKLDQRHRPGPCRFSARRAGAILVLTPALAFVVTGCTQPAAPDPAVPPASDSIAATSIAGARPSKRSERAMRAAARELVHPPKIVLFSTPVERAIACGDDIVPLIVEESDDFAALDRDNARGIAEALGSISGERSRALMLDLCSRSDRIAQLTGMLALAQRGALPDPEEARALLVETIQGDSGAALKELAIIALGKARDPAGLPCLCEVLREPWTGSLQAYACEAVARIGSSSGVPVVEDCLRSPAFDALPDAFRALIALGDASPRPSSRATRAWPSSFPSAPPSAGGSPRRSSGPAAAATACAAASTAAPSRAWWCRARAVSGCWSTTRWRKRAG